MKKNTQKSINLQQPQPRPQLVELDNERQKLTPSTLEVLDMEQLECIAGGPVDEQTNPR